MKKGAAHFVFRRASVDDARILFDWRNEAATRKNSIDPRTITWDEHVVWLQNAEDTAPSGRTLLIAERDHQPVGTVRIDESEDGYSDISYTVAPECRGQGVGSAMVVQCAREFLAGKKIRARIREGNFPSESIARALGLKPIANGAGGPVVVWQ